MLRRLRRGPESHQVAEHHLSPGVRSRKLRAEP
jgi:hypothetical protein